MGEPRAEGPASGGGSKPVDHGSFHADGEGNLWCDGCTAMVHELVEHLGSHEYADFVVGLDGAGVRHATRATTGAGAP